MVEHPLPTFIPSNKKAMKNKSLFLIGVFCFTTLMSCSQNNATDENITQKTAIKESKPQKEPHQFGGWYCHDNLNGFPALDLDTKPAFCYSPVPDGKKGNMKLPSGCVWCRYKFDCHQDANDGAGLRVFKYSTGRTYLTTVVSEPNVEEIL